MKEFLITMAALIFTVALSVFLYYQNNTLTLSKIEYKNSSLPKGFDGCKVVHVSDLQNKSFGENQNLVLPFIENLKPDIIFITGDLIDRRSTNFKNASDLIDGLLKMCKVYYVPGNHEIDSKIYDVLKDDMIQKGVIVLENDNTIIERNGDIIEIIGIKDPADPIRGRRKYSEKDAMKNFLRNFERPDTFSIMLSHRPEHFNMYLKNNISLIFSGHAHGGQIRLPLIGGLYSPNQGVFPKYTKGAYNNGETTMIVSRGLGNSKFPFRIFNRPNIVEVILKKT